MTIDRQGLAKWMAYWDEREGMANFMMQRPLGVDLIQYGAYIAPDLTIHEMPMYSVVRPDHAHRSIEELIGTPEYFKDGAVFEGGRRARDREHVHPSFAWAWEEFPRFVGWDGSPRQWLKKHQQYLPKKVRKDDIVVAWEKVQPGGFVEEGVTSRRLNSESVVYTRFQGESLRTIVLNIHYVTMKSYGNDWWRGKGVLEI